jgi:hypothetical protein
MIVEDLIKELQKLPQAMQVELNCNYRRFFIDQIFITNDPPFEVIIYGTQK